MLSSHLNQAELSESGLSAEDPMEVDMFARTVSMRLKPNTAAEFTRRMDREIIPLLRKQKGFQDEITLISAGGNEALGISLWEQKENLEDYQREIYPAGAEGLGEGVGGNSSGANG